MSIIQQREKTHESESDVVYNVDKKFFPVTHGRGISLPNREEFSPLVTNDDYNNALMHLYYESDAFNTLLNRLRYEKLRKITSHDGWNPFDLQQVDVCTPIPIADIEHYGYDEHTSSCRCPNKLVPCTRQQALGDRSFWSFRLRKLTAQSKVTRRYDRLKIATKHLNVISSKGILIQTTPFDAPVSRKRQICNSVDVVLCSVRDNSKTSTQWSPWGGCSEKCNRGVQERFKIIYNNDTVELAVNKKPCELAKCSDYNTLTEPQCSMSIVPPNEQSNVTVSSCACSKEGHVLCSSEEARLTMSSWLPQFREYCKKHLDMDQNNKVLYEDMPGLKAGYLGRFIHLRFNDGYYFDCAERWGLLDKNYTTSYCKVGSPVLCREQIAKTANNASFLETTFNDKVTTGSLIFTGPVVLWAIGLTVVYTLLGFLIKSRRRRIY